VGRCWGHEISVVVDLEEGRRMGYRGGVLVERKGRGKERRGREV
jgi:hypothetical protein